jgi:hypothetical protein
LAVTPESFGVPQGFAQLLSEKGACVTCFPSRPHRHSKHDGELATSGVFFPLFGASFPPARKGGCKGFIYTGAFNDLKGATATL